MVISLTFHQTFLWKTQALTLLGQSCWNSHSFSHFVFHILMKERLKHNRTRSQRSRCLDAVPLKTAGLHITQTDWQRCERKKSLNMECAPRVIKTTTDKMWTSETYQADWKWSRVRVVCVCEQHWTTDGLQRERKSGSVPANTFNTADLHILSWHYLYCLSHAAWWVCAFLKLGLVKNCGWECNNWTFF